MAPINLIFKFFFLVNPKVSIGIDNKLGNSENSNKLTYFYSRVETFTEILTPGALRLVSRPKVLVFYLWT